MSDITHAAGPVRRWALHDRPELRTWASDRLTVLGDAAHPMLPFMAQGANQAVEYAVELAALLAGARRDDIPDVLARYERARAPTYGSRSAGLPGSCGRHALAAGLTGLRERAWLYGHEAGTVSEGRTRG
ncbi:FAD-dependent monooxygenase [Streptomyces sp. NPDC046915]|uniref:FAD-dependent monooxygenase n=1 Tax=Streptomyces sp. NPDC046915 TaxID=3155257 RepID=UPI0033D7D9BA